MTIRCEECGHDNNDHMGGLVAALLVGLGLLLGLGFFQCADWIWRVCGFGG